jgi:hypothetical protein
MKTKPVLLALLLCVLAVSGCRPAVDLLPVNSTPLQQPAYTMEADTWTALFNAFWQGMSENYVYWDVEPVDYWDTVWDTYKPQFDALGPYPGSEDSITVNIHEAMTCFAAMLAPLKDGHLQMNLVALNNGTLPARKRVLARYADADQNTNPQSAFYFNNWSGAPAGWNPDDNYDFWEGAISGYFTNTDVTTVNPESPFEFFHIATGRKMLNGGGYILYLYFSSFEINAHLKDEGVLEVMRQFMRDLVGEGCKGVIFDLRGNSGGSSVDLALLLGPLLERDMPIGYIRTKKSPGRLDYLPYTPYLILAASEDADMKHLGRPDLKVRAANAGNIAVTALVNDYSASNGEFMPIAIRDMGGKIVGTQTWGATGLLILAHFSPDYVNGGSFSIADSGAGGASQIAILVEEAGWQFRGLNYENYEGIGVTRTTSCPLTTPNSGRPRARNRARAETFSLKRRWR